MRSTNYGLYAFGALSCEERELAASEQAGAIGEQAPIDCREDADCEWTSLSTACWADCGGLIAAAASEEVTGLLMSINENICRDFEADGCGPVIAPPCVPPPAFACVEGRCASTM